MNGIEGFWSLFQREYHDTFHHLSDKHLDRYVWKFTGRINILDIDTLEQMPFLARSIVGKRLPAMRIWAHDDGDCPRPEGQGPSPDLDGR